MNLRQDAATDERIEAGRFRCCQRFRQQPQNKARKIRAAFFIAEPVGNERGEIDLAQLGLDRCGFEKMHLHEFAELVGDTVLVALDDRGVRDWQPQRPAEQGYHRVPVRETADGRGFRERGDKAEGWMHIQQRLGGDEERQRAGQHQRRQRLDAPQLGGAGSVAGSVARKCAGGAHDGFRTLPSLATKSPPQAGPITQRQSWSLFEF